MIFSKMCVNEQVLLASLPIKHKRNMYDNRRQLGEHKLTPNRNRYCIDSDLYY